MCVCVCVWDRPEALTKAQGNPTASQTVHAVSLCVIGGVIELVWLSEMVVVVGRWHGHICGYWASCIDPGSDS